MAIERLPCEQIDDFFFLSVRHQSEPIVNSSETSKLEYDVAKYLRSKLPEKRTTLMGHKVNYFIGKSGFTF